MYDVIIVLDESRNKSYYYSYVAKNGNIKCAELPPYADISKAQSCYWNDGDWIYDEDKYAEIVTMRETEKAAAEQAAKEADATPTVKELSDAVMELASGVSDLMDAVTELADEIAAVKGSE